MPYVFQLQDRLLRNNELFASEVDGDLIVLDEKASVYFAFDPVASRIWTLLEKPMSFGELVGALVQEYQVSREVCEADTNAFLDRLLENKLLYVDPT
ncbi:MAG: PqqD family protein [Gammaproteobacteria bacterium]|nr:PqqD family protein [Gammaproteobacteria bacterium]